MCIPTLLSTCTNIKLGFKLRYQGIAVENEINRWKSWRNQAENLLEIDPKISVKFIAKRFCLFNFVPSDNTTKE